MSRRYRRVTSVLTFRKKKTGRRFIEENAHWMACSMAKSQGDFLIAYMMIG
jgi:hypothetical protein